MSLFPDLTQVNFKPETTFVELTFAHTAPALVAAVADAFNCSESTNARTRVKVTRFIKRDYNRIFTNHGLRLRHGFAHCLRPI
jgi:hypothetical protein